MLKLSIRQKREVYSISSLLLHLLVFIALLFSLNSCSLLHPDDEPTPEACTTLATVKDMRGLDGCSFILVLDTGERLQPVAAPDNWCGTTSQAQASEVSLADGQRVRIGYKEVAMATTCMAGKTVQLTCLSVVTANPPPGG